MAPGDPCLLFGEEEKMAVRLAAFLLASLLASPAQPQSKKEEMTKADVLQQAYAKYLLLRARPPLNKTHLPPGVFASLLRAVEQLRFEVHDWEPNSPETYRWCMAATAEEQVKAGEVTTKGEAVVTLSALRKRCSEVVTHAFEAWHQCRRYMTKKRRWKWQCTVWAKVALTKYKAVAKKDGTVALEVDRSFGRNGIEVLLSSGTDTSSSKATAITNAAFVAGLYLERRIRDIDYFQLRAPIVAHRPGRTYFCLGRDAVELDTPFHVLKPTEEGVEKVGFVKARKLFDGCVLTPRLEKLKKQGRRIVLRPSEAQDIIGSNEIQVGMSLWEMPSIGLYIGLTAGVMPFDWPEVEPGFGLVVEYDLARHIGVSEFYVAMDAKFGVYGLIANDKLRDRGGAFRQGHPVSQMNFGFFKRWYLRRVFFELGGFVSASFALAKNYETNEYEYLPYAIGGMGRLGFGVQLSPRVLMRFAAGFRGSARRSTSVPSDTGIVGSLDFLYNI